MKEETKKRCELLVQNRDVFREAFMWEDWLTCLAGAGIFTMAGKRADVAALKQCKKMIAKKVSAFSNFLGVVRVPVAAILTESGREEQLMEQGLTVYKRLKKDFMSSSYLPMAAMMIAQMTEEKDYEELAERTRTLYKRIKAEHPFLTSSEDSPLCALLALSKKSDDELILDMEKCYEVLKPQFMHANALQSLTHVLALFDEPAELKCEKTMQLFHGLKEAGKKYGTNYELPALGVLAMTDMPVKEIIQEMIEIDEWLSKQKGFGLWSNVTPKQRLMYAGMLAQNENIRTDAVRAASVGSMVAMILAQEMVIIIMFVCSITVAASNSSSS